MKKYKLFDVSMPINTGMVVYPNNPEVLIREVPGRAISEVTMGSHTGTHLDAPKHAIKSARGIDAYTLDCFYGPCRVLDFSNVRESLKIANFKKARVKRGERILVKTKNSGLSMKRFSESYIFLDPDAAEYLASIRITLFGTDYLSVKKRGAPDNRSHTELLSKKIPIIEGLRLKGVSAGKYILSAFPLNIDKCDGAPLRAVLIKQ